MTILRLTAIRCLCRDRGLERVKDSVVLKEVYRGVVLMVTRWIPNPKLAVRIRSPLPI
jgi:hypothetical protein